MDQRKITREIRKYIELNVIQTTATFFWNVNKAVLRGKFIALNEKRERSQIHSIIFHLRKLIREGQTEPKGSRKNEIVKIRT